MGSPIQARGTRSALMLGTSVVNQSRTASGRSKPPAPNALSSVLQPAQASLAAVQTAAFSGILPGHLLRSGGTLWAGHRSTRLERRTFWHPLAPECSEDGEAQADHDQYQGTADRIAAVCRPLILSARRAIAAAAPVTVPHTMTMGLLG
jgi:hypothetical protein